MKKYFLYWTSLETTAYSVPMGMYSSEEEAEAAKPECIEELIDQGATRLDAESGYWEIEAKDYFS